MHASIPLVIALSSLALAQNRVFKGVGAKPCQTCLAEVEASCKGPTSSDEFNSCFCDAQGPAWETLAKCVVNSDCLKDQYQILSYYGAHCFAYRDDEEEEFCVDASQEDEIKMSVADMFCTEFVTPSASKATSATTTQGSASLATASEASATAVGTQTNVDDQPQGTNVAEGASATGSSSDAQDDDTRNDKDNAAFGPSAVGTTGAVAVALWSCVMAIQMF